MAERSRTEWLRSASLACWVRGTIWGRDSVTPYGLLGWDEPVARRAPVSRKEAAEVFRKRVEQDWARRINGEKGH